MKSEKISGKKAAKSALFGALCLLAGFMNGLLGTGGGIILVYLFTYIMGTNRKDSFAMSLAAMLPVSAVSAYLYVRAGSVALSDAVPLAIPAVIGGICGAILSDRVKTGFLNKIFALLVIYAGLNMILRGK